MTQYFTEEHSVTAVNDRMAEDIAPRLKDVMTCLIQHLHSFAKEIELTQEEWDYGIAFLTKTGQMCSVERQEFILLSDTLGFSMLVDAINNRRPLGTTENTVFGPFFVEGAPIYQLGDSINLDGKGESCLFEGRVIDTHGEPIEGARIDVWSDDADGFYDVQKPSEIPKWNNRGRFITGSDGSYRFTGIKPVSYPIPDDGPVGQMLGHLGRHPFRPAHVHFMVVAPEHETIVTHTFVGDDEYLSDDAVFGVKDSLVAPFEHVKGDTVWRSPFDFVMVPKGKGLKS